MADIPASNGTHPNTPLREQTPPWPQFGGQKSTRLAAGTLSSDPVRGIPLPYLMGTVTGVSAWEAWDQLSSSHTVS